MAEGAAATVFDTVIGPVGIAWGANGIVAVQLPERDAAATRLRLGRRAPGAEDAAPPPDVAEVIGRIRTTLEGDGDDLTDVTLDVDGVAPFDQQVYELTRKVGPGATTTYGAIAIELGDLGAAQAVGQSLGRNPFPIIVPCHRVLAAGGALGGFSANGGTVTKERMLILEGALPEPPPTLFD